MGGTAPAFVFMYGGAGNGTNIWPDKGMQDFGSGVPGSVPGLQGEQAGTFPFY
jgi:hypothetical protein